VLPPAWHLGMAPRIAAAPDWRRYVKRQRRKGQLQSHLCPAFIAAIRSADSVVHGPLVESLAYE
jgi:hypothetical protein